MDFGKQKFPTHLQKPNTKKPLKPINQPTKNKGEKTPNQNKNNQRLQFSRMWLGRLDFKQVIKTQSSG